MRFGTVRYNGVRCFQNCGGFWVKKKPCGSERRHYVVISILGQRMKDVHMPT